MFRKIIFINWMQTTGFTGHFSSRQNHQTYPYSENKWTEIPTICMEFTKFEADTYFKNFAKFNYGGPQLSQQQQITHSNNKLIATTTKTSHQNQIAHSTNKMLTAQTKTLTAQTKTLTAQTKTLTAPPNRGGLSCLFLDLKKEGTTWPWQVKIFAEVLTS